jgi:hypothetical protein
VASKQRRKPINMEGGSRKIINRKLGRKLSFKAKYIDQLFNGEKTTTVRRGIVTPRYDVVYIESNGKIHGTARVKYVRYTKLGELTNDDAVKDGFSSKEELINALKEIYPDIGKDEWVTIISLDNLNRFAEPLPTEMITRDIDSDKISEVAQIALANGLAENEKERRILAMLAINGDIKATSKHLGIKEGEAKLVLAKIMNKLKEKGIQQQ